MSFVAYQRPKRKSRLIGVLSEDQTKVVDVLDGSVWKVKEIQRGDSGGDLVYGDGSVKELRVDVVMVEGRE